MVSESEGQWLKTLIPNGKMLTTSELRQGTLENAIICCRMHIVNCEENLNGRRRLSVKAEKGWNHDDKLVPLWEELFYVLKKRS